MDIADKNKQHNEIIEINNLNDFIYDLKCSKRYIAKSEYIDVIAKHKETIDFFKALIKGELLEEYCKKNRLSSSGVKQLIEVYDNIENEIDKHNDEFVKETLIVEKDYLDNVLKGVDHAVVLDDNQREVVVSDEDHTLVIAGAGAGKTTTVAAKAKYLVDKQNIPANEILIVSFTNKAVGELRDKINKALKLDCIISTFHSIGNAILKTQSSEPQNIIQEEKLYYILLDYFKKSVLTNESLTKKLVMFFSTYFDAPYDGTEVSKVLNELSRTNYTTFKSDLEKYKKEIIDRRSKKKQTIQNEIVRSYQEVQIANYLYLNNIDYEYEPIYQYNIKLANKPYTPDFKITQNGKIAYIEHFGITQNGENSMFNAKQLEKYKKAVNDKIVLHREHKTNLIYTFSEYNDGRTILQHLNEELVKNGFVLKKKDDKEVLKKLIDSEESKYVSKLIILICRFINLFKTNGYNADDFTNFKNSTTNVRNHLFLDICKECYLEYERYLKENNAIDFQDMINNSALVLKDMADKKEKLHFKYVFVDEYQDISRQRFDLVGALKKVCDAKVMAVGDDWQSIYAFSGSDVDLFLDFKEKMGYAKIMKIENTYRNSQEVIDIAGNFIQKNEKQIKKTLKSPKHIDDPIIIYTYDSSKKEFNTNNKSGAIYNMALSVQKCLDDIVEYNKKENKNANKVLILGRYNYDKNNLDISGLFQIGYKKAKIKSVNHPQLDITFMTAHASKGLGYDNVIIINCKNEKFGFPSKIESDPVLKHVIKEDNSYSYAEERRLFYVAMTRTKNRVYCVAPQAYPSEFLVEIYKDYENIVKHGEWVEEAVSTNYTRKCPICGYPMQYRYKPAYGLKLNICTNDPEICGFITNDIKAGKMQIMKCDQCQDGYLIVKSGKNGYFLGCTNYKDDGTGCNNTISKEQYYEMVSLTPDKPIESKIKKDNKADKDMKIVLNKPTTYEKKVLHPKDNENDMYECAKIIISCVNNLSNTVYFGTDKVVKVLLGKKVDTKVNYTDLPEYGLLKSCKELEIKLLIAAMVRNDYLHKTKSRYPVLHPTNKGKDFLVKAINSDIKKLFTVFKDNLEKAQNNESTDTIAKSNKDNNSKEPQKKK